MESSLEDDAGRWPRLRSILEQALDLAPEERAAFLATACGGDTELQREAARLLEHEGAAARQLTSPLRGVLSAALAGDAPRADAQIGGYRLVRAIASGGMGTVWEAEQASPRRKVALKLLRFGFHGPREVERFRYEAEVLGRLSHPGIAQVYEAGVGLDGAEVPYFAMEFVEGAQTLVEHAREQRLARRARLELFETICDAVHFAHQKGVIHRDLKPGNVLVDGAGRAKVIDFGVARASAADPESRTRRTETGQIVGTLQYMSPEQFGPDAHDLDTRSDVYSLGVALYELLLERLPFDIDGRPIHEVASIVSTQSPRPPSAVDATFPRELEWIVLKAMASDRTQRYASASELAADVRRYLDEQPVHAGRPSTVYRMRKFVRRNRFAVGAAAALAAALVVGLIGTGLGFLRARDENRRVMRLSDIKRHGDLVNEARALWPPDPERVGPYTAWLARARDLEQRLPQHRAALANLAPDPGDIEAQWHREALAALVLDLEASFDAEHGLRADVEQRLAFASTIEERSRTGVEARARWQAAIEALAALDAYHGLRITPQLGLLPLGEDPESGLFECAHLQSGTPAERGSDGRIVLREENGIVLVLLPGGDFAMGSQSADPNAPNYDPASEPAEQPVHDVALDPFFIAKYELTQAQWQRIAGTRPSWYPNAAYETPGEQAGLHPVEQVSWNDCATMLARWSLELPTDAQWEYACRGGTTTPWWTGSDRQSLAGAANLGDQTTLEHDIWVPEVEEWLDDDHLYTAPVGRFRANPFGLHDMLGNVVEWCRDPWAFYSTPQRARDGLFESGDASGRMVRGGTYSFGAGLARSAARRSDGADALSGLCGVRAARRLR